MQYEIQKRLFAIAIGVEVLIGLAGITLRYNLLKIDLQSLIANIDLAKVTLACISGIALGSTIGITRNIKIWREATEFIRAKVMLLISGSIKRAFTLSLFAGFCEELFFRAFLQEWIGLIPASLIFVALHGYYRLKPRGMIYIGIFTTIISIVLGLIYEHWGYMSAATMHFAYDFSALLFIMRHQTQPLTNENQ